MIESIRKVERERHDAVLRHHPFPFSHRFAFVRSEFDGQFYGLLADILDLEAEGFVLPENPVILDQRIGIGGGPGRIFPGPPGQSRFGNIETPQGDVRFAGTVLFPDLYRDGLGFARHQEEVIVGIEDREHEFTSGLVDGFQAKHQSRNLVLVGQGNRKIVTVIRDLTGDFGLRRGFSDASQCLEVAFLAAAPVEVFRKDTAIGSGQA